MVVLSTYCLNSVANTVSTKANGEELIGELTNNIAIYRGIPFAAPPVAQLRWQAPQAHTPRNGKQLATHFAPACMQSLRLVEWYKNIVTNFDNDPSVIQTPDFDEDCLYLNIWAPLNTSEDKKQTLPVMVWIHGGSNNSGWSYEPNYLGHQLAQQDVIVVSIAYRLGIFGFFAHPELSQQQAINANFGLLDQIAALQWIKQYIHHFGGDGENITVFGESAGAADIGYLIASPKAKGLFKRAIHQSAGFEMFSHKTTADDEKLGKALTRELKLKNISELRAVDSQTLQSAAAITYKDHYFSPVIDGYILSENPIKTFATQQQNPVDLMIGSNANEWYMYLDADTKRQDVNDYIKQNASASAQKPLMQWADQQIDLRIALDRLYSAKEMLCPSVYMATQTITGNSRWMYYFTRQRDGKAAKTMKAYHGAEIPYVFDTADNWLPTSEDDNLLTSKMLRYWSNFAKTGNPNSEGLAVWPNFDQENSTMELGDNIVSIAMPEPLLCQWLSPAVHM
jgi:para-nitrobenzyl esterase